MLLFPKNFKYRKQHFYKIRFVNYKSIYPKFGSFYIKALESGFLTSVQIESCRRTIKRYVRKSGKLWIRVFPDLSITTKPLGVRMGRGKGSHKFWASFVKKGQVLFEVNANNLFDIEESLRLVVLRLPIKVKAFKLKY